MCDPRDHSLSIATKNMDGDGALYKVPAQLADKGTNVLQPVGTAPPSITDGGWELTSDGEPRLVLTDYWRLYRLDGVLARELKAEGIEPLSATASATKTA